MNKEEFLKAAEQHYDAYFEGRVTPYEFQLALFNLGGYVIGGCEKEPIK